MAAVDTERNFANAEKKLIILCLLDKIDIPLSYNDISNFVLEEDYMDYITLQTCLHEMMDTGYLEKDTDKNVARYYITSTGTDVLNQFENKISQVVVKSACRYIEENAGKIKKDFEIVANFFIENFSENPNKYTVKCGAYEEDTTIMEIKLTCDSREQAKRICKNWKENVSQIYGSIISEITR